MGSSDDYREFDAKSVSDKIDHVQDLWDRIARTPGAVQVSDRNRAELNRRVEAHEVDSGGYSTWKELRKRLERKLP